MKLLGWMQHKLRQNNIEPFKDFTTGNYCSCLSAYSSLNDEDSHLKSTSTYGHGARYSTHPKEENEKFTEFEAEGVEGNFGDKTSTVIPRLFHGFLTIGTLQSDLTISEPITPTFTMSLENITEGKTEGTENDLKVINDELEKFLEAEAEAEAEGHGSIESSRRSSLASTITLSSKPMQEVNVEEYENAIICPFRGYLLGSSIERPEFEVKKEKQSLAELFYCAKTAEESPKEKCGKEEMQTKQTSKTLKCLIKKILKKFHASSGSSISSTKETNSVPTKKKLQKVIKLFHRKIYPESSIAERELTQLDRNKMKNPPYNDGNYTNGEQMHQDKVKNWFSQRSMSEVGIHSYKSISVVPQPQYRVTGSTAASSNGEHWIKTDADYSSDIDCIELCNQVVV
ncbi:hypothetical protein F3Y22_tig00110430pilonHSYRG00195 [Hibiscus syriacus]|uniref:Protein LAZY 1-like n=1 Tax=Hibiscus syriacus TaxID=106335 RepID=A0A6A3AQE2_HIBSY|nr:hypothetical protein F3Y22_tig00110430pilonHSYRG00195 [Hibiscus syriacus]